MRASARGREASARMDQSTRVLREKRGRRRFGCIAFSGSSLRRKASQDAGLRGARLRPAGSGGAQFIGNCRTLRGGGFGPPGSESRNFKRGRRKQLFRDGLGKGSPNGSDFAIGRTTAHFCASFVESASKLAICRRFARFSGKLYYLCVRKTELQSNTR